MTFSLNRWRYHLTHFLKAKAKIKLTADELVFSCKHGPSVSLPNPVFLFANAVVMTNDH